MNLFISVLFPQLPSAPQTPHNGNAGDEHEHIRGGNADVDASAVDFQSEVPKRHGERGEAFRLGKRVRPVVVFHGKRLFTQVRAETRYGFLAKRRTGLILGLFAREPVGRRALRSVPYKQSAERAAEPMTLHFALPYVQPHHADGWRMCQPFGDGFERFQGIKAFGSGEQPVAAGGVVAHHSQFVVPRVRAVKGASGQGRRIGQCKSYQYGRTETSACHGNK